MVVGVNGMVVVVAVGVRIDSVDVGRNDRLACGGCNAVAEDDGRLVEIVVERSVDDR